MAPTMITTITAYKFITLASDELLMLQEQCQQQATMHTLKGTILLSVEGINLTVAGSQEAIDTFKQFLSGYSFFFDLVYKENQSFIPPFKKFRVRIKKEIITMRCLEDIQPEFKTASYISPQTLQEWYRKGKDMILLDARNVFEVSLGTFTDAIDLNLKSFGEFPDALNQLPPSLKKKTIITFCTGGIRCEKASALMIQRGFQDVYQLDGGILNYLAACGSSYFEGDCFIFDNRITLGAVNHWLE
jgi:UPF0176 protein